MRPMTMVFKSPDKHNFLQFCMGISFVLMVTTLHAEVAIKNSQENDKVLSSEVSPKAGLDVPVTAKKATDWLLKAEQWELTRNGEALLSVPVLHTVINAWLQDKQKKIEIQYPGGEEGELWVQELADWLVSLGIPSTDIVASPGSGADDIIKFDLIQ